MKKIFNVSVTVLLVSVFLFSAAKISRAEEAKSLEVVKLVIAKDIVEREPVDEGDSFTSDVGSLYCFSKIKVNVESAKIFHCWYFNDEKVFQIELGVKGSPGFRTYSNKTIMDNQKGNWEVEVQDADGNVLDSVKFTVK